ncbi:uncharacterized protein LOC128554102, partial [Mercenaria mercenaria]|uniref:uncharacterized protein LOC128554102 n=1 Tax=Mercenaria mercenaria TaxID=6596 RepID=UPI00234E75F2
MTSQTMSKGKALLDKRKRRMPQSGLALSTELGQQTFDRKRKGDMSESKKLLFSIDNNANRCREVIEEMQDMFNNKAENIRQYPRVKDWMYVFLNCYLRDFMLSLSTETQLDIIEVFNETSRYIDDILDMENLYFSEMMEHIYPKELQLNKANTSDLEASFLDFHLTICLVIHSCPSHWCCHTAWIVFLVHYRKELAEIEKKLEFKPVVIAVIGNIGEGKSSLMNAILDKGDVLPTSGKESCTATVVEVVQSETDFFEAEIEFLKEEEWFDELRKLCKDLTDENGVVTKTPPDRNSGIYNSYCKMVALYGEIDKFDILSKKTELTECLGQTKPIRAAKLEEFKEKVESYVETQESGTDQCFWPIVKRVCLKLPECGVCSSGAKLVDLPGCGDSDEARNAIAKSHLDKCDHIWIVSSIHRAINDRTAQQLLGEQQRSQFYMNGQFDAVSFICTKTDCVIVSECQRELKQLKGLTKELNDQVLELNKQKEDMSKEIKELTLSIKEEQKDLDEAKSCLEDERYQDEDESVLCEKEDLEKEVKNIENSVKDKENQVHNLNSKLQRLDYKHNEKIKAIKEICAKVRNEYCETRIKERFASSYELRNLKDACKRLRFALEDLLKCSVLRRFALEDLLKCSVLRRVTLEDVFKCSVLRSSVEYQLLEHPEPNDAAPMVFSNVDDTQIPKLRNFVHEITSTRKKESLTDTLSSLDGFVSSVKSYLLDKEVMKSSKQSFTIDSKLQKLKSSMDCNLEKLRSDLDDIFDENLIVKLRDGASAATEEANEISNSWGAQDVVLQEIKQFLDEFVIDFAIPEDASSKRFRETLECTASTK